LSLSVFDKQRPYSAKRHELLSLQKYKKETEMKEENEKIRNFATTETTETT
jgi:hypothetical protein